MRADEKRSADRSDSEGSEEEEDPEDLMSVAVACCFASRSSTLHMIL